MAPPPASGRLLALDARGHQDDDLADEVEEVEEVEAAAGEDAAASRPSIREAVSSRYTGPPEG